MALASHNFAVQRSFKHAAFLDVSFHGISVVFAGQTRHGVLLKQLSSNEPQKTQERNMKALFPVCRKRENHLISW